MCHAGHAPVPDGAPVAPALSRPAYPLPDTLFPDPAERAALILVLEGIRDRSLTLIRRGGKPGSLRLRRELDPSGRRLWAIREDRDPWLPFVTLPRGFMAFAPPRRALALLEAARAAVAVARATAADGEEAREVARGPLRLVR